MCEKSEASASTEADRDPISTDKLADVWISHNTLRWRVVLSTPVFGATVMIGWYSLRQAGVAYAPDAVLFIGIIAMAAYYVLIRRLTEYSGAYYNVIPGKPIVSSALLGLSASKMALSIPVLLAILFLILLLFDLPLPQKKATP